MTIVFKNDDLIPAAWHDPATTASARVFNPGLVRDGSDWVMAYRVVTEPRLERRIAMCRLDSQFRVIAGSALPFTDGICFDDARSYPVRVTTWFADPRLYRLEGRFFLHWNSGWHEPQNHQFLQEIDAVTLRPIGAPRELLLRGGRQKLEKNWMLFERSGLFAVYSVNPHRTLSFSLAGGGAVEFRDCGDPVPNPMGFAHKHGGLRGGAPPQRVDNHFYSFCHSIEDGAEGYRYVASVYRFAADPPFLPTDVPTRSLPIVLPANARRGLPKLNPAVDDVVYPGGAAFHDQHWIVSCGVDDERCAIVILPHDLVLETLASVNPA